MMNEIFKMVIGDKLFLAPIERDKVKNVLDMGTGTGICESWNDPLVVVQSSRQGLTGAIEFADMFPHAQVRYYFYSIATRPDRHRFLTDCVFQVLGNDLSPVQPDFVPPNLRFEVDDLENDWTHPTPFDFIFCRYLVSSITDWPALVNKVYECVLVL